MSVGRRLPANLATLANGLVGVGSIAYTLLGNPVWGMLLLVSGVGFDGLDGFLARRAGLPPSRFGRIADSCSDAITFGLAPAVLLSFHTAHAGAWAAWTGWALAVAVLVAALTIARLAYFTIWGYQAKDFLGAPSPQNALAIVVLVLLGDVPGFLTVAPGPVLGIALLVSLLMVVPVPFPKIRRGSPLRMPMIVTALALVVAILPIQFALDRNSVAFGGAELATVVAAVGLAIYYLLGPFTVPSKEIPPG